MRILFAPHQVGINTSNSGLRHKAGLPFASVSSLRDVKAELDSVSPNSGNMIHAEAAAKTFACDRSLSCFGRWPRVVGRPQAHVQEMMKRIERDFDAVVLSFANIIQTFDSATEERMQSLLDSFENTAIYVEQLNIPVFALGIGLQNELPPERSAVAPKLLRLLQAINDKGAIFGVRGETTERWLHSIGLTKAKALGCPSMFAYPRNILAIRPPAGPDGVWAAAGRLQNRGKQGERVDLLKTIGDAFAADYVFQNDLFLLTHGHDDEAVYDDATGELNRAFILRLTRARAGFESPFRSHYFFRDPNRWRMFASMRRAYVGDRFHGGVAFMQAGKPAVILQSDARVRELTDILGIPTLPIADLTPDNVQRKVLDALSADRLAAFKTIYLKRLRAYVSACEHAGLSFVDRDLIQSLTAEPTQVAA